jgi:hypothetical protein
MRALIAVLAILFMMLPAHAQMGMGKGRHAQTQQKQDSTAAKADDKAYKEALKRIPLPQQSSDPWRSMR